MRSHNHLLEDEYNTLVDGSSCCALKHVLHQHYFQYKAYVCEEFQFVLQNFLQVSLKFLFFHQKHLRRFAAVPGLLQQSNLFQSYFSLFHKNKKVLPWCASLRGVEGSVVNIICSLSSFVNPPEIFLIFFECCVNLQSKRDRQKELRRIYFDKDC